ncbi:DUF805 domain-containing protein [Maricaulis salignorans]|uniref:Uncharacterized membrane protein YhaH, DUF805 family n=1 Tax=Maricaulis salignorans TaxID=144026 RepID=A0A1G9VUA2_9PROT|nr:DUF805 domain-containing protein [Maricaulis salignorans]SDM75842.1 Uncharacterized membrane protein YhaH, DUF805 family [Maricaulis salignorans]
MNFQDFIIDPKDAKRILIGASGKLGPMDFAQGLVAIIAGSLILNLVSLVPGIGPLVGFLGGLVLAFAWVCIFSKRFHDAGQSGWMTVAAIVAVIVLSVVIAMILTPLFGGASFTDMSRMQTMGFGFAVKNMITSVLANAAVGYYMFKLKPALL